MVVFGVFPKSRIHCIRCFFHFIRKGIIRDIPDLIALFIPDDQILRRFDQASEPELVESCIYEIKAINARFSYLYRAIRERSGEAAAAGKQEANEAWV